MTDKNGKDSGIEQAEPSFSGHYDFSDLKDVHPTTAALAYLDKGDWTFVPVDTHTGEVDLAEGVGAASRDVATVLEWADELGIAVGIATGRRSGVVALECTSELGQKTLKVLQARYGAIETLGNGSKFLLFKATAEALQSREQVAPGLDFLGEGRFFVPSHSSWGTRHTVLAPLPEWLHEIIAGGSTFGIIDLVTAGHFEAINEATLPEAARAYRALGWKPAKVAERTEPISSRRKNHQREAPKEAPVVKLGVETGGEGGIVALMIKNYVFLAELEKKHGQLPLPKFSSSGSIHVHCFRAPQEHFPSQLLFPGVKYIGEDDGVPVPPSMQEGDRLQWKVGKDFSPELPELPPWLLAMLSTHPKGPLGAQARPKAAKASKQPGKGKGPKAVTEAQQPPQASELSHLGTVALRLAAKGLFVFPVKPDGETPLFPKEGSSSATRDRIAISQWWKKNPVANIGVQTGHQSRLVVLEVDAQGAATLDDLEKNHGHLETLRAKTPSRGLQLFFLAPPKRIGSMKEFKPGLSFCGEGGHVVVAPSSVAGHQYRWETPHVAMVQLPDWLLALVSVHVQQEEGAPPDQSVAATTGLAEQLEKWIAARCEVGESFSEKSSDLLENFSSWFGETVTGPRFGELLRGKGYRSHKESSGWWYRGLRLRKGQ